MKRSDWNARYAERDLVWGEEANRFVAEELGEQAATGRALDLACGEGRNAVWLAERGWEVTAVDFSDVALERGRRLQARRGVEVDWLCEDLSNYEPPTGAFGLVLISYLQLPGAERRSVLERAAPALVSGGELFMIGHARCNLGRGVGGPRDPTVLWTPDEIADELESLDLQVERCEHVQRSVETPDGVRPAFDVLARAISITRA